MAAQLEVLLVDHVELGGYHFGIGDALGIGAAHEVLDMVGNLGVELLHHFVVLDVDDGGKGCDKGYLADLLDGEVFVFDLDDAFLYPEFNSVEYVLTEDYDKEVTGRQVDRTEVMLWQN